MRTKHDSGFISLLLLLIISLALLKYFFNWSIFDAAASEQGRATIAYIRDLLNLTWSYIGAPFTFVWNEILWPIIDLAWSSFQSFISQKGSININ